MISALIYFHSQGNIRGKIGRALVTKPLKWWAAGCPSPTSEDEQLCPAAVDEEACSAQDHKGISLLILYLACINRALGPVRARRMMPCFSTNITYICDDNCWYKRKLNNKFEEGILCNQFIEKPPITLRKFPKCNKTASSKYIAIVSMYRGILFKQIFLLCKYLIGSGPADGLHWQPLTQLQHNPLRQLRSGKLHPMELLVVALRGWDYCSQCLTTLQKGSLQSFAQTASLRKSHEQQRLSAGRRVWSQRDEFKVSDCQ